MAKTIRNYEDFKKSSLPKSRTRSLQRFIDGVRITGALGRALMSNPSTVPVGLRSKGRSFESFGLFNVVRDSRPPFHVLSWSLTEKGKQIKQRLMELD